MEKNFLAEIVLPSKTKKVLIGDIPKLFADAIYLGVNENEPRQVIELNMNQQILWHNAIDEYEKAIRNSVHTQLLKPIDPRTFLPSPNASGEWLNNCFVTLENLKAYAESLNIGVSLSDDDTDTHKKLENLNQETDTELSRLFDPVGKNELEKMFPSGKWHLWADKAQANGLISARVGRGKFNPYLAAIWWLKKQEPHGWDLARCQRALANNLPARSKGFESRLTWQD
jgi:hypothetical protein